MKPGRNLIRIWLLCAAMLPAVAQAQFTFTTNNGAITITSYTGTDGAVVIPSTTNGYPVTDIGDYAFSGSGMASVVIPSSILRIGNFAFSSCNSLTNSVTIPDSVTYIGSYAFSYCANLVSVIIPKTVTGMGRLLCLGSTNLQAITVDAQNPTYISSVDGVLFDKSQTLLLECPGGKAGSYTMPDSVTSIVGDAFRSCVNLISITVGKNVTSVYSWAFASCSNLTAVYFKGNAPSVVVGSDLFTGVNIAIVYYLPGTTGWHSTFGTPPGQRPTALWNPQAATSDGSFGVQSNQFGFNITGSSNLLIVVEASTNLVNPVWSPLGTNTLNIFIGTNGTSYFSDPQWTNYPGRFYRLRSP